MNEKKRRRSAEWFGNADKDGFVHRSWMKNQGMPDDQFDGRPVIGICNTWSELTPCNAHFRELAVCLFFFNLVVCIFISFTANLLLPTYN